MTIEVFSEGKKNEVLIKMMTYSERVSSSRNIYYREPRRGACVACWRDRMGAGI